MRGSGQLVGCVALSHMVSGAMLAWRPDVASAVGETCHGLAATVVGTPGDTVGRSRPSDPGLAPTADATPVESEH